MAKTNRTKFNFVGEFATAKEHLKVSKYQWGSTEKIVSFVKKDSNVSAFLDIQCMKGKKQFDIEYKSKEHKDAETKEFTIPYANRLNKDIIAAVPDYKKLVIDLETDFEVKDELRKLRYEIRTDKWENDITDETKEKEKLYAEKCVNRIEVLTNEDFLTKINENIELLKGKKVHVSGELKFEVNKKSGAIYRKFVPSLIEFAPEEWANKLEIKTDYFFGEESINDDDFEDTKIININGYVEHWDKISESNKLFPLKLVIDGSKLDMENPKHVARLNIMKEMMNSDDEFRKLPVVISYFRGGKEVDFSEDMLTDSQMALVEAGLKSIDDFKPKGGVIGDNIEMLKLVNFDLKGDFANGSIKVFDEDELANKVFRFEEKITINTKTSEVKKETVEVETKSAEDELEDLFS